MMRKLLSKFLNALVATFGAEKSPRHSDALSGYTAPMTSAVAPLTKQKATSRLPKDPPQVIAPPKVIAPSPRKAASPASSPAVISATTAPSLQALPRIPAVPALLMAQYWRSSLDYISFRDFASKQGKAPGNLLFRKSASHMLALGAAPTDDGTFPSGKNAHVVLTLREQHKPETNEQAKRHFLLAVPAVITDSGLLVARIDAAPVINEDYLEPNVAPHCFKIAHRETANDLLVNKLCSLASNKSVEITWLTWWNTIVGVLQTLLDVKDDAGLCQRAAQMLRQADTSKNPVRGWDLEACVYGADEGGTNQIAGVYDSIKLALPQAQSGLSLFKRLCATDDARNIHDLRTGSYPAITSHIDEYDSATRRRALFPLDATQRLAVKAILSLNEGEIQAVNGPPGSGKTSMLRAVVASQWVSAALRGADCPITLACGATNQSVTNVIGAFGNAPHPDATLPHAQRWIADASSYGAYLPAITRLSNPKYRAELKSQVCLQSQKGGGFPYQYWDRTDVLDPRRALDYEEAYLTHARGALLQSDLGTVEDVVSAVWQKLKGVDDERRAFMATLSDGVRAKTFIVQYANLHPTAWTKERASYIADRLLAITAGGPDLPLAAEELSDLLWRADAFHWAARYWEGRFLLAQRERLMTRHPRNIEETLRRICMLTPCIVSTLHNAPSLFAIEPSLIPSGHPVSHVLGKVDLLVVDEAGQASPELAAAAFALARRAAVIGDLKQLAPIWNHTKLSEIQIAAQSDTVPFLNDIIRSERSSASGSALGIARLVSKWRELDTLGVSLRYHYRCKPNIIAYCNALAYGGDLITKTKETDDGPEPSLAWVSVDATPSPAGGSWRNTQEAQEIVSWIVERWPIWRTHPRTGGKAISEVVALITPYRAQADLLMATLKREIAAARTSRPGEWPSEGDVADVTVGTVHKLQGAERPIVCFSLVEGPEQATSSFIDADASMLNVAVSRAKSTFAIFANPARLFSIATEEEARRTGTSLPATFITSLSPSHQLGAHLRYQVTAAPLYPKRAVFIESPNKCDTLRAILGKSSAIVATSGALTDLPLFVGVDIEGGFIPHARLGDKAQAFIDAAKKVLPSVAEVVLATDDDRMGEYIGWQIRRALAPALQGKRLVRARLGTITRSAVMAAVSANDSLDERKIAAEIIREIADCLIAGRFSSRLSSCFSSHLSSDVSQRVKQLPVIAVPDEKLNRLQALGALADNDALQSKAVSVGRVQAAVLRLLMDAADKQLANTEQNRIAVAIALGATNGSGASTLYGALIHTDGRDTTPKSTTKKVMAKLRDRPLRFSEPPQIERDTVSAPASGTVSLMAEAWRRFHLAPWDTMTALNALFDGNWIRPNLVSYDTDSFEPLSPIEPASQIGHPPVTPLDRAASPEVLKDAFADEACRQVYGLIWERWEATEENSYEIALCCLDLLVDEPGATALRVRLHGGTLTTAATSAHSPKPVSAELTTLMFAPSEPPANAFSEVLEFWNRYPLENVSLTFTDLPAAQWDMPLDHLLLTLEAAGIGRPSTIAGVLRKLEQKQLIVLPSLSGSVRLTKNGLLTAQTLAQTEPALSAPDFTTTLEAKTSEIETGRSTPREVLFWLACYFMSRAEAIQLRPKIWDTLDDLVRSMDTIAVTHPQGSIVSTAPRGAESGA